MQDTQSVRELPVKLVTIWAAKVREILAVNKQTAQNFDVERFNLRKPSDPEFRI